MLYSHFGCLMLALGTWAQNKDDTFDEKPKEVLDPEKIDNIRFNTEEDVKPETALNQEYTNQTEEETRDLFDDSEVIDEFNERYVHRMLARSAAISLSSTKKAECEDKDDNCGTWALQGYCFSNAGYMSQACPRSCDVCNLARCGDNHIKCEKWAAGGECQSNPDYMTVTCSKSCGLCPPLRLETEQKGCEEEEVNLQGRTGSNLVRGVASWPDCAKHCQKQTGCKGWVWAHLGAGEYAGNCALVEGFTNKAADPNVISGSSDCIAPVDSVPPSTTTTTTTPPTTTPSFRQPATKAIASNCQEVGMNLQGRIGSTLVKGVGSWEDCGKNCQNREGCKAWVWANKGAGDYAGNCALVEGFSDKVSDANTVTGNKDCIGSEDNPQTTTKSPDETEITTIPSSKQNEESWMITRGLDCYEGVGGVAIQPDPYSKDLSLNECQESCQQEPLCVAIIRDSNNGQDSGLCYLRQSIEKDDCVKDAQWDLHSLARKDISSTTTKQPPTAKPSTPKPSTTTNTAEKEWKLHLGYDCYQGKGGDPINPDPLPDKVSLTECKEACLAAAECEGIIRETSDSDGPGLCYLRKNLQLSECGQGSKWEAHTNSRYREEGSGDDTTTGEESSCADYNQYCSAWAKSGECSRSQYYMNIYCKKSCGICSGGGGGETDIPDTITPSGCKDTRTDCLQLAKAGHCYARPGQDNKVRTMEVSCRRSCGFCGSIPDHILDQHSCATVTSIPRHVIQKYSIDSRFYGKFTQAYGMPVTAGKSVDDRALMRMCYMVRWLYASHRNARRGAHVNFGRFIIIGKNQRTTQMPEYRHMDPYYDERARGFGAHVTSTSEENLLYLQKNKWRGMDMGGHEVAHHFHLTGLSKGKPSLFRAISQAFTSAMAAGKYYSGGRSMYARTDYREYFAEAFCSYIGDTWSSVPPHSSSELYRYDPTVYSTLTQALSCNKITDWIYVHNDLDQVLSRTQRLKINYPACNLEPAVNIPKESDIILAKKSGTFTSTRERCKFPFSFGGRSYTSCTTAYHSNNWYRASWCATSTYSNGVWQDSATPSHQNSWGYCGSDPAEQARGCTRTSSGKPCIFPYKYLGVQHNSCQGKGWCATSVDSRTNMQTWSKCDPSCFSRLENEAISTGYNTLSG